MFLFKRGAEKFLSFLMHLFSEVGICSIVYSPMYLMRNAVKLLPMLLYIG